MIEEHLQEVRCLRQRLEESIRTNERLRQQLEERLATNGRDGGIVAFTDLEMSKLSLLYLRSYINKPFFVQGLPLTSTFRDWTRSLNCPMRSES